MDISKLLNPDDTPTEPGSNKRKLPDKETTPEIDPAESSKSKEQQNVSKPAAPKSNKVKFILLPRMIGDMVSDLMQSGASALVPPNHPYFEDVLEVADSDYSLLKHGPLVNANGTQPPTSRYYYFWCTRFEDSVYCERRDYPPKKRR